MATADRALPAGCAIHDLTTHSDERGALTEIFRKEWRTRIDPVQWNFVNSAPNVLRGVHVHVLHADYLVCTGGSMLLALGRHPARIADAWHRGRG